MERIIRYFIAGLFVAFLGSAFCFAENVFFLEHASGARGIGLGQAYSALSDEVDSLLWNPAGFAALKVPQVQITLSQNFEWVSNHFVGGVYPIDSKLVVGLGYVFSDVSGIILTDANANITNANAQFRNQALLGGVGYQLLDEVSIGATGKAIHKSIEAKQNWGAAVDVGMQVKVHPMYKTSVVIKEVVATQIGADTISPTLVWGNAFQPFGHVVAITADTWISEHRQPDVHVGLEVSPMYMVSLRGGFSQLKQLHLGVRLNLTGLVFDYAWSGHDLGVLHRLSLSVDI